MAGLTRSGYHTILPICPSKVKLIFLMTVINVLDVS